MGPMAPTARATLVPIAVVAFAFACNASDSSFPEDGIVVTDDKSDDFISTAAVEFIIEGRSFVTVEDGEGLERAEELIRLKHVAISWFLNDFLIEEENTTTGEVSGFGAMVKTGSFEDLEIRQLNARSFEFTFEQIVTGTKDLPSLLEVESDGAFAIEIGKPTNEELARLEVNNEWYRKPPWSPWKPEMTAASKKELIQLAIRAEKPTPDAWWDFQRLIEDDVITVDVHHGWDFHDNHHIKDSAAMYRWLVREKGFEPPVADFADYKRTSGPLSRTINADGREVEVRIRLFWGRPGESTDPDTDAGGRLLENDLRRSLKTADIIVFQGHSGPFFGFPMANWKKTEEGDLDDSEMPFVEMPADKYQIVFGEGCDTLMIGPAFLDNVNKNGKNIDVVTTTALSDSESTPVNAFLSRLLDLDSVGRHRPRTIRALLSQLDRAAMYGVHGAADNPRVHPYARPDLFCDRCSSNSDCGGAGNACIVVADDGRRCAAACTDDDACGEGFRCMKVASEADRTVFANMCVAETLECQ